MIGLIDYNLQTTDNQYLTPPNLEIMKLATYYRGEQNIFCRLVDLNETEFSGYDKIYIFSEQNQMPILPPTVLHANNIVLGGTAFTNGNYIPFENELIDFTLPRPTIYKDFLKEKYSEGIKSNVISHILDDSYYRMYAGNKKLPIPPVRKNKRFFIYDKDFFYPDWESTLEKIINRNPSSIFRIHPIICNTLTQFFSLRGFNKIARSNDIIIDIRIPLEDVNYMLKKYKNLFLAEIVQSSRIYLPIGGSYISSFQYYKDLIYKLNLLFSFWSQNIPIKTLYIKPKLGITNPIEELELLIGKWSRGRRTKTIEEKIRKPITKKDIVIEAKQRDIVIKHHPSAKNLFIQSYPELVKRGYWRI